MIQPLSIEELDVLFFPTSAWYTTHTTSYLLTFHFIYSFATSVTLLKHTGHHKKMSNNLGVLLGYQEHPKYRFQYTQI